MAKDRLSNHAHYVSADRLRIGLYIHVDLPWFRHPFTLNSFRIGSEEQIRELRALGETRFRYDPQRSDGKAVGEPVTFTYTCPPDPSLN